MNHADLATNRNSFLVWKDAKKQSVAVVPFPMTRADRFARIYSIDLENNRV